MNTINRPCDALPHTPSVLSRCFCVRLRRTVAGVAVAALPNRVGDTDGAPNWSIPERMRRFGQGQTVAPGSADVNVKWGRFGAEKFSHYPRQYTGNNIWICCLRISKTASRIPILQV